MEKHINVVVLSFVVIAALTVQNTETVEVKVYYKAQSLQCDEFITKQLYPTYMAVNTQKPFGSFGDSSYNTYMTVRLVPYGNSFQLTQLENGTWQIECKAWGDRTCIYNKYHACAIDIATTAWRSLNYITAMVESSHHSPDTIAKLTCFDDHQMPACVNTVDGDELLIGHGRDTLNVDLSRSGLPLVTFDGKYEEGEQRAARENLLALVCEKTANVPAVCNTPRAKRAMTHLNFGTGVYYPKKTLCEY